MANLERVYVNGIPYTFPTGGSGGGNPELEKDYNIQIKGSIKMTDFINLVPNGTGGLVNTSNFNSFVMELPLGIKVKDKNSNGFYCCFFDEEPKLGDQYDLTIGKVSLNNFVEIKKPYIFVMGNSKTLEVELEVANSLKDDVYRFNFLRGKKILCLGDSNTEYAGINNKSYPQYISEISNCTVINGGFGGSRLARRREIPETISDNGGAYSTLDCVSLVESFQSGDWSKQYEAATFLGSGTYRNIIDTLSSVNIADIDIITIYHMSNDWQGSNAVGEIDSTTETEIYGAFNKIMDILYTLNPKLQIYFILPFPVWVTNTDTGQPVWSSDRKNRVNLTLEEVCEKIKIIAGTYGIPVLDLYHTLGFNKKNIATYCQTQMEQHARAGYDVIAEKIVKFLNAN